LFYSLQPNFTNFQISRTFIMLKSSISILIIFALYKKDSVIGTQANKVSPSQCSKTKIANMHDGEHARWKSRPFKKMYIHSRMLILHPLIFLKRNLGCCTLVWATRIFVGQYCYPTRTFIHTFQSPTSQTMAATKKLQVQWKTWTLTRYL
jgi:hypothetical protein